MQQSTTATKRLMVSDLRDSRSLSSVLLFGLLCVIGVGGCNRGPKMVQVSGKVLYKDGTVPHGGVCVVNFIPTPESTAVIKKAASGAIGPDGSFSLTTRTSNDGVYVGEYAVSFTVFPGPMDPRSLVLQKYASPALTPFKVKLDNNTSDLKYEVEPAPGIAGAAAGSASTPKAENKPAG
jgi:hypothetical protein